MENITSLNKETLNPRATESNASSPVKDQAELAAILEADFDKLKHLDNGTRLDITDSDMDIDSALDGFEIVETGYFYRGKDGQCAKAITLRDSDGNYYVHFNGTGDGNWPYNAVAYGPQNGKITSDVQDWSLNYFDHIYETYCKDRSGGKIYVSGHSQGANNAQFVTIRSQYGEEIDTCISLDGPGFSHQSIEEAKALYGTDHYNSQCDKIYGFYGEFDYVSCLGQEHIIPRGHTSYVNYDFEKNKLNVEWFHSWKGLVKGDNKHHILETLQTDYSSFRELVLKLNDKITSLPQEQQAEAAQLTMKLFENLMGVGGDSEENLLVDFSPEELKKLEDILIPIIIETLEEEPELIHSVLKELQIDPAYTELIMSVIAEFNKLDPDTRNKAFELLTKLIVVDESGKVTIIKDGKDILRTIFDVVLNNREGLDAILETIIEVVINHPEDIFAVLNKLGIFDYIAEHPVEAVGISLLAVVLFPSVAAAGIGISILLTVVEGIYQGIQLLGNMIESAKTFVLNTLSAIKVALSKFGAWLNKVFNKGAKYASANPYIKVDTVKLRSYASRIANVNRRLRNLDSSMRSLYWQVGFLDLWDILMANLITCESYTLSRVQTYLNNAGDNFDTAESSAGGYMGG